MRVVKTELVPLPTARAAAIEVVVVEQDPPRKWRLWLAVKLIALAGRLAKMRVRIVRDIR